jgi:hypothetical protein
MKLVYSFIIEQGTKNKLKSYFTNKKWIQKRRKKLQRKSTNRGTQRRSQLLKGSFKGKSSWTTLMVNKH